MLSQEVIDKYLLSDCLRPVKVYNKYTHDVLYVPCGHCYSCLKNKSNRDTSLTMNIASNFKYCYFVFLSYTEKFLPCMEMVSEDPVDDNRINYKFCSVNRNMIVSGNKKKNNRGKDRFINDEKFEFTHSMTSTEYKDIIVKSHGRYDFSRKCVIYPRFEDCDNKIPYCNTSDCQKFLKRLRFHIKAEHNEEVRFYGVSEYGPRTFRPHWHLLLFFDSDEVAKVISQYVSESWSYGNSTCELSKGGSASYVASYVNSNVCLPSLYLEHKEIKARSFHSKGYGTNHVFPREGKIYDIEKMSDILLNGESISVNGEVRQIFPSWSYKHTVFPRFSNIVCKSPYRSSLLFSAAFFAPERLFRLGYLDVTYDKKDSPVSELVHAYTNFFLDRENKGFVHFDDELIVACARLDAPNRKYWHCLTYRLFNMVFRSARFWNLFDYTDLYRRGAIYDLMNASDAYWNEYARRRLLDYFEFLENCDDKKRSFLFHRTAANGLFNSSEDIKRDYSYDPVLSQEFLKELTADNRKACVDKVKHKEFNDLSGLLLTT